MQIHEEHIIPALDDFAERAADFLVERIRRAVRDGRPCSVILAGGTTPRPVYAGLSRRLGALPAGLGTLSFFIGDERVVAPESPERNERMIREAFGAFFDETHKRLYPWEPPPLSAPAAAARYERTLAGYFQGPRAKPDLAVLGLGADGHTASLFPNAVVLRRTKETEPVGPTLPGRAVAVFRPDEKAWRLSLTARFLSQSREVVFLIGGRNKGAAYRSLKTGDQSLPAAWIAGPTITVFALGEALAD